MATRHLLAGVSFVACATSLFAQSGEQPLPGLDAPARYAEWKQQRGAGWVAHRDSTTGFMEFVGGGSAAPAFAPQDDADFFDLGRLFVEETSPFTGLESATLRDARFKYVPLGLVGGSDKVAVRYAQEVGGVPVLGGSVNVLFDVEGRALSVQSTALPNVAGLSTSPALTDTRAAARAVELFGQRQGLPGTVVAGPVLGVGRRDVGRRVVPALVWEVELLWEAADVQPVGFRYWIDAADGSLVHEATTVHNFDVGGTVSTRATPGVLPDTSANPEQSFPVQYARVTSSAGTVFTDANGQFNYPGVNGPLSCTFEYVGTYADVNNDAGGEYTLTQSLTGTGNSVTMNPSPTELTTSQGNAYRHIGILRDWIRSIDPTDSTADFQALANTNLNQNCNAFFNGGSVNFYTSGGGCPNTAYSTVISHEMGHWLNVRYGTGNGDDGIGEGNADVFSTYLYDTPIVGEDFCGTNCDIRNGNNTRQFCGDNNPGCHGGVHNNGEVWMGATWKVRVNLNNTHGDAMGDAIADALFSAWLNVYDQTQIKSVMLTQWLTLDDTDGNIGNGTPNRTDINAGFVAQGFPGHELDSIQFDNVTVLPDTSNVAGPYTVDADIVPLLAPPLSQQRLFHRFNGGAWTAVPMTPTGGDGYTADIPGPGAPGFVDYYLQATDSGGNSETFPPAGAQSPLSFNVGLTVAFFDDFETVGDNGWTHASFGNTSNDQDDWQHGPVFGKSGDPTAAFSGSRVWGNDLGPTGWNGAYQDDVNSWLRSPVLDLSTASAVFLRFQRWLNVESGQYDQARIRVNGVQVYVNPSNGDLLSDSWTLQTVDITALASANPAVQVEFSLQTDGGVTFGGWTIDDFTVLVESGPVCPTPANYGQAKTNSQGLEALMGWVGSPTLSSNDFTLIVSNGIPGQPGVFFSGEAAANVPLFGGFRLVANPITREGNVTLDAFGDAALPLTVTPALVGTTRYYQAWYRDPADPTGFGVGLSDGLEVTFCD